MLEKINALTSKIITLNSSNQGEPIEEFTPINLEILLSESIVESASECMLKCESRDEKKKIYGGGFKLTGNSMSLKLNDTEYETTPDLVHFILSGNGVADGGKGIFRRHFSKFNHSGDQKKMISEKVIGDLVLNFKQKDNTNNVYLVLPIFNTEHSNKNGAEIIKLANGINAGNTKKREKDGLMKTEKKEGDDLMGFNQLQVTSNANMSTNGFRDFETVNLTNMIKTEVPIMHYKIDDGTIFLIFLTSSINVSKHALYSNKLLGQLNITSSFSKNKSISELKYYTNGIEVDTRKSMNCQPISETGQVIKEINKGPTNEKEEMDIIRQLEALTKTIPGQVLFGVLATIFLYLVVFSSMNIVNKVYNFTNSATKVLSKELGFRGVGIAGNLKAAGIRGQLKPQNKGKPSK